MKQHQKPLRILLATLVVYALLCATHLGEFWPFSIYPMFSQAGRPWTRTLIREVPPEPSDRLLWRTADLSVLPGHPLALQPYGIAQNDVAGYVSRTESWDGERIQGLRALFSSDSLHYRHLLIVRMQGRLEGRDSVAVAAIPFLLFTPDSTYLNPHLSSPVHP